MLEESRPVYHWTVRGHWNRGATCRAEGGTHTVEKIQTLLCRKDRKRKKGRKAVPTR